MTWPGIDVAVEGTVATVTLCRPNVLNAPDRAMHTALVEVWGAIAERDDVRSMVLTGAGRAFSAGSDRALLRLLLDDRDARADVLAEAAAMLRALVDVPVPVVAAVNGPAVGLACSLVAMCDLVVMASDAYFLDPHVPVGLGGGDGVAVAWPPLAGLLAAKEHALLGTRLSAERAQQLGIVNRVVGRPEVLAEATGLARRLAALPPQAVRETKRVLTIGLRSHLERALPLALQAEATSFDTLENRAALGAALGGSDQQRSSTRGEALT